MGLDLNLDVGTGFFKDFLTLPDEVNSVRAALVGGCALCTCYLIYGVLFFAELVGLFNKITQEVTNRIQ